MNNNVIESESLNLKCRFIALEWPFSPYRSPLRCIDWGGAGV